MNFFGMTSNADAEDDLDRVETDVVVDCGTEVAWALASEPGWWVNDDPLGNHEVTLGDSGIYRMSDPDAGDWLIEKADEDPTDVVAFRWYPLADDELPGECATRIRIFLPEERDGIAICVEKSGLASVSDGEAEARQAHEDEIGMWRQVLNTMKNYLEGRWISEFLRRHLGTPVVSRYRGISRANDV